MPTLMLVDAENVRRSTWPNLSREEFALRCGRWSQREGVHALVVYDGDAPQVEGVVTEGSGARTADDRIVELATETDAPLWLVTSDDELRARVGLRAQRTIGGGVFVRELLAL